MRHRKNVKCKTKTSRGLEEFNLNQNEMNIKTRKGGKAKESYASDIYKVLAPLKLPDIVFF